MKREYLPLNSLPAWAKLNGVVSKGITFRTLGSAESSTDKGNAITATVDMSNNDTDTAAEALLCIPRDLILSLETVHDYSKSDRDLREVLEAIGDFGRV